MTMSDEQGSADDPQGRYYDRYLTDDEKKAGGRNKRTAIVAGGVAAVLLAGGVGALALTGGGNDENTVASTNSGAPSGTSSSDGHSEPSEPSTSSSNPTTQDLSAKFGKPTKPGWGTVASTQTDKGEVAVDIPSTWVHRKGWSVTWAAADNPSTLVGANAASTWGQGQCKTDAEAAYAVAGFIPAVGTGDSRKASADAAKRFAGVMARREDGTTAKVGPVKTTGVKVEGGKTSAAQSVVTVDRGVRDTKACESPRVEVRMVAMPVGTGNRVLIIVQDAGSKRPPVSEVEGIIESFRAAKG